MALRHLLLSVGAVVAFFQDSPLGLLCVGVLALVDISHHLSRGRLA
jgi:hypothetical protein